MARQQQGQANQTFGTATNNSAQYGGDASTINGALTPFLMQRLTNPQGYSQGDMGAMLANAMGGAGGATSGITGQANLQAGRSRNDAGFSSALDAAARSRTAAAAGSAEGVAANNANLKQDQTNNAAKMLQGMYGTDVGAQNEALNTANSATNTGIEAGKSGWLQNMTGLISALGGAASGAGAAKTAFCWIAAELYGGWEDQRTIDVRRWLLEDYSKTRIGRVVCELYRRFGERTADMIRTHRWMRKPFKVLFDCALRKARA
jgi:hypothetical protein